MKCVIIGTGKGKVEGKWGHLRVSLRNTINGSQQNRVNEPAMEWYASHLYRTIHRIAARDKALSLGIGEDGRLEVSAGGKRIAHNVSRFRDSIQDAGNMTRTRVPRCFLASILISPP